MNYNKSVWVDVFSEKDFRRYRKGRIVAKLINIGFGNVVNSDKIIAVVSPEAAPVKRMVQRAKESNRIIDAICNMTGDTLEEGAKYELR